MNGTTGKVEIRVKEYGGTYIATCKSAKVRASCTAGAESAAHVCADKIFGKTGFTLTRRADGAAIWTAEALKAAEPAAPVKAWRSSEDLPDAEITVMIRGSDDEYPVWTGFYDGERWCIADGTAIDSQCPGWKVTGWMHLEDAARILDAAAAVDKKPAIKDNALELLQVVRWLKIVKANVTGTDDITTLDNLIEWAEEERKTNLAAIAPY